MVLKNIESSHWVTCFASSFTTEDLSCGMVAILICFEVEYLPLMACKNTRLLSIEELHWEKKQGHSVLCH